MMQREPLLLDQIEDLHHINLLIIHSMKNSTKLFSIILLASNTLVLTAQQLDKMSARQRETYLIATAKEIIMKYGPDYYREYKPPVVKRFQVPPKGDLNPSGENAGRVLYNVLLLYNKEEEQLGHDFAASVDFWENNGKPYTVFFGNGWGFMISDNWRTDTTTEQNPYQEIEVLPVYDLSNPDPNQEPKNKDELIRKGYEKRGERGEWVKTRSDLPPAEAQRVIRQAKDDMGKK